jgi:hypothetical protein
MTLAPVSPLDEQIGQPEHFIAQQTAGRTDESIWRESNERMTDRGLWWIVVFPGMFLKAKRDKPLFSVQ